MSGDNYVTSVQMDFGFLVKKLFLLIMCLDKFLIWVRACPFGCVSLLSYSGSA